MSRLLLVLLAVAPASAYGQTRTPVILNVPNSVRSAALQGAGAALVGDASSVFINPAGLATIRHMALEGSLWQTPRDGFVASGSFGMRLRQFDIGFGLQYLNRGDLLAPALDSLAGVPHVPIAGPTYEAMGVGSLIYRFGMIALGGSTKIIREKSEAVVQRAIGIDAGLAIAIFDIVALGFSTQNVGGNLEGQSVLELPSLSRLGFTMNYVDPQGTFRLLSTAEVQWPEGRSSRFVLGLEGGIIVSGVGIKARGAWSGSATGLSQSKVTYGGSVELSRFDIDYAFDGTNLLDEPAHRFGVRLRL